MLDTPNGVGHFLRQGDDSVQDTAVSSPNMFWDTELPRQRQVDVVCTSMTGNVGSVRIMARVCADRLFDGLLNEYKDTKKVIQICNQLTTVKDGITIPLNSVDWQVQSTVLVGDVLVPATYKAVAYYSGRAYYSAATGYISTAEYKGTVVCSEVRDITYVVTYVGTPIAIPTETPVQKEDTDVLPTPEVIERAQIADLPERTDRGILPYVVGGAVLLAVLGGTTGVVVHSVRKRRENNKYEEDSDEEE